VQPLPVVDLSAKIAFDVVVVAFVLLEWRIRLRSTLNRQGSRATPYTAAYRQRRRSSKALHRHAWHAYAVALITL